MGVENDKESLGSGDFPEFSKDFSQTVGPSATQRFTIEKVTNPQTLEQEWEPLLVEIFADEGDREPIELLKERLEDGENFFLMRNEAGEAVGIELSQILLNASETAESRAMYIPWTGVTENYRNNGIGSQMNRQISEHMREEYGVTHTIIDIEDPDRMHDSGYAPEELDEAIDLAGRRINFWRREGFLVVDDETKPTGEKLEYVRPASDDEQNIQGYDHLTVRLDDAALKAKVLSEDGTMIDKNFVRECYMDMTLIQYGDMTEDELRQEYPAVDQYLNDIDNVPHSHIALRTSAITPKRTSDADIQITMTGINTAPAVEHVNEHGL